MSTVEEGIAGLCSSKVEVWRFDCGIWRSVCVWMGKGSVAIYEEVSLLRLARWVRHTWAQRFRKASILVEDIDLSGW
jgi:hypothetical protein